MSSNLNFILVIDFGDSIQVAVCLSPCLGFQTSLKTICKYLVFLLSSTSAKQQSSYRSGDTDELVLMVSAEEGSDREVKLWRITFDLMSIIFSTICDLLVAVSDRPRRLSINEKIPDPCQPPNYVRKYRYQIVDTFIFSFDHFIKH